MMGNILKKEPVTEMEYWETIEGIGGILWHTRHDISHGRYEETDELKQFLANAQETIERLVSELEKFGVIQPKDCPQTEPGQDKPPAPEGKKYYWDWYNQMKETANQRFYDSIICSACPFSEGVEGMTSDHIPCGHPQCGIVFHLRLPYVCNLIGELTEEQLFQEIFDKGGEDALTKFKEKLAALKAAARQ